MPPQRNNQDILYQQLTSEFNATYAEVVSFRAEMKSLKEAIEPLVRALRGDGTSPTVFTQVALLEQGIRHLNEAHDENKEKLNDLSDSVDDIKTADKQGRWQVAVAICAGVLGVLASAVQALFQMAK